MKIRPTFCKKLSKYLKLIKSSLNWQSVWKVFALFGLEGLSRTDWGIFEPLQWECPLVLWLSPHSEILNPPRSSNFSISKSFHQILSKFFRQFKSQTNNVTSLMDDPSKEFLNLAKTRIVRVTFFRRGFSNLKLENSKSFCVALDINIKIEQFVVFILQVFLVGGVRVLWGVFL